ncbi:Paired domain-containing protein [Meloidogyne graminicola]|uniref:Paired domain-containing protein n=1 Tax=Meloidogyne graminicola TaxID=189291 RepID=A0A8S9ZI08_9BILA|nr:Paired domain-containing protein [Meloidogyne graminicola]
MSERQQIVDLHKSGWKICDISKCLCVTHSCVSKILQRYRTTGSVRPKDAKEGRQESPLVAAIRDYRVRLGIVRQSEIREQLIRDGLCRRENAPSRSSINHILRTKLNNIIDRQNNKTEANKQK